MLIVSEKENFRLVILQDLQSGKIDRAKAARLMEISLRQLDRVKKSFAKKGLPGLVHGNRGRKSNRAMPDDFAKEVISIVASRYKDFGPTLASEKLREIHKKKVSIEKLRQLMIAEGLWKPKSRKKLRLYQRRSRRSKRGELIQGDASHHDWFEGRGPKCALVSFIDDATGRVTARFEPGETYEGYSRLMQDYIREHGCPGALYVDKAGIFRVNKGKNTGSEVTAFGKILKQLNIELICAHTPQAKGRVERMYSTFQDRVIKEMRLANVCTIEEANKFLSWYLPIYNSRFSKSPASEEDGHHHLSDELQLYQIFTRTNIRKLSKNLEFSFEGVLYQVTDCKEPRRMMNQPVVVFTALDGKKWAECKGQRLTIQAYNETVAGPQTMDRKQVDAWLDRKRPLTVKQKLNRGIRLPV